MNHEIHEIHESAGPLLLGDEVFQIQGAIFKVYRSLGSGFLEAVYQECLGLEFRKRGIPFQAMPSLQLWYDGELLSQRYSPDFICFETVLLELKAVRALAPEHRAQVINYLRASGLRLGLLVNFSSPNKAQIERFAL